jgi:serine/threonine-protein kinase
MVMELLEGVNLADRLTEDPPLADSEIVDIVSMALSGLAAVHDQGIVHRDIKPENIFLVEDADGFFAKIVDFGISRGFDRPDAGRLTSTGGVVGTPSYMSPEQARGLRDVDPRSDLFSMGTILYECLTGRRPFDSENLGDILIMVASSNPKPPELVRPDLPTAIAEVIERAMQHERNARYQSAREMRNALDAAGAALTGSLTVRRTYPSPAPSPPTLDAPMAGQRSAEYVLPTGRRRLAATITVGALLVASAAAAFVVLRDRSEPAPPGEGDRTTAAAAPAEREEPTAGETGRDLAGRDEQPAAPEEHGAGDTPATAREPERAEDDPGSTETGRPARRAAGRRGTRERASARPRTAMQPAARTEMATTPPAEERPGAYIRDLDY